MALRLVDAERDYARALDVALQWFGTWQRSRDERHRQTALACSAVARELFMVVKTHREAKRDYSKLELARNNAELATTVAELEQTTAGCRATLQELQSQRRNAR
jgi:hypothetical protein